VSGRGGTVEDGFVVLDALMAVGLVALAGTTTVLILLGVLQRQGDELDRSVALVMSQSLMRQYLLIAGTGSSSLETSDEGFTYEVSVAADPETPSMQRAAVIAKGRARKNAGELRLDFLVPTIVVGGAS
jgi:hypothetical protein